MKRRTREGEVDCRPPIFLRLRGTQRITYQTLGAQLCHTPSKKMLQGWERSRSRVKKIYMQVPLGGGAERSLYSRGHTPDLPSRGPTPTRDVAGVNSLRNTGGDHSRIQSSGSTIVINPSADEHTAAPPPSAFVSPFVVRAIQDGSDCPQLEVPSRPVRYLLLREGCFALRLESALHEPLIAKLEVDGKMTKSNFRILPNSSHTIRETRGGTGMHAVPLAFAPSIEQRRSANSLEDVDLHTGLLRIFFYAVANMNDGKWEIASRQQPLEVVMLKYGFRDTLARYFNVPLLAGGGANSKDRAGNPHRGGAGVVPPIPKDIAVYHSMAVPALGGGGGGAGVLPCAPSRTSTPPARAATPKLRPQLSPRQAAPGLVPTTQLSNPMSELFGGARGGIETADKLQEKIAIGAPPGIHRAVHLEPFVTKFDGLQAPPVVGQSQQKQQAPARPVEGSQFSVCVNCDRLFGVERARMLAEIERWKKKTSDLTRQNSALHQKVALLNTQSRMLQEDLARMSAAVQRTSVPSRSLKQQQQQSNAPHHRLDNAMELLDQITRDNVNAQSEERDLAEVDDEEHYKYHHQRRESSGGKGHLDMQGAMRDGSSLERDVQEVVVLQKATRWDASELHTEYHIEGQKFVSPAKKPLTTNQQQAPRSYANNVLLPPYTTRGATSASSSLSQQSSRAASRSQGGDGPINATASQPLTGAAPEGDDDILNMAMKIIQQERQQQQAASMPSSAATPQGKPQTVSTGSQVKPIERPLSATRQLLVSSDDQDWEPPAVALPTPTSARDQGNGRRQSEGDEDPSPRRRRSPSPPPAAVAYIDPFARRTRR